MRIALDAHGGDVGLKRNISAAFELRDEPSIDVILVGNRGQIEAELRRQSISSSTFAIVHAEEQIGMGESAVQAVRRKTNNSISVAMELVKSGQADAFVSAGHSGAVVASALMTLGRIPGVTRPALGTRIPSPGNIAFVLDIGAVIDPKPEVLLQFGYLGAAYAHTVLGIESPTVALLSNGEETSKGNSLTRSARDLLAEADLNFIGYVEGRDMLDRPPHVTVTDGFTGNVALKIAEGTASFISGMLRRELTASFRTKVLALALRPVFRKIRDQLDFEGIGGAPLLGVNGVVIVAHGHSSTPALVNAIRAAAHAAEMGLTDRLRAALPRSIREDTHERELTVTSS